jgi:cysteine synthase A
MKPKLKPPGSKRLKLKCVVPLSGTAFKLNVRRYTMMAAYGAAVERVRPVSIAHRDHFVNVARRRAGAYTRPLFSST